MGARSILSKKKICGTVKKEECEGTVCRVKRCRGGLTKLSHCLHSGDHT